MWILPFVGYLGLLLGFAFLTLAIASGLYYLSELVEEHSVLAKKLLTRLIYVVIAVQVLLLVDRLPLFPSLLSIGSHVVYLQNLRRFPIVKLTDPIFILSCVLVLTNHFFWFRHFSAPPKQTGGYNYYDAYAQPDLPTFTEIASFFGIQVWLVPFSLFVSLSAGEYVLPSMGSEYATGTGSSFASPGQEPTGSGYGLGSGLSSNGGAFSRGGRKRAGTNQGMAKAAVNGVREWIGETGELMGFWKGERTRPTFN
ncbi:Protein SVP26 [Sphaceloma murrayae]|uniref:Protein SVP26 n=1 Tax=Sphaceloma murrayae TaxID=2082308 RepID=A0A2K1QS24_9PEZI|nr:Protein SVP26 [Sphaceloma murrayae]